MADTNRKSGTGTDTFNTQNLNPSHLFTTFRYKTKQHKKPAFVGAEFRKCDFIFAALIMLEILVVRLELTLGEVLGLDFGLGDFG